MQWPSPAFARPTSPVVRRGTVASGSGLCIGSDWMMAKRGDGAGPHPSTVLAQAMSDAI